MSRQYTNFVKKLQNHNAKIVTSVNDYIADKDTNKYPQFEIECEQGHIFTIRVTSLHNKISQLDKNGGSICAECDKPEICGEEMNARTKCKELGFEFVSYQDRQVYYVCKCGNSTNTHATNLLRQGRQAQCPKCQNDKNRNPIKDVKKAFRDAGCELLSEYTSRHKLVDYRCCCGTISKIRYADFVKGKRCFENCKMRKYVETCLREYGVINLFQLEETKEKSRKTCKEKFGVEYCMQNKEIQSKAKATAFSTKNFVDGKYIWIVQGYEPFCIRDLLDSHHPENIITDNVPSINYVFDKDRVWHPDIFLKNTETIIEVKSTFTYDIHAKQMKAKMIHCPYDCELHVYNRNGTLFEKVIKYKDVNFFIYKYGDKFVMGKKI